MQEENRGRLTPLQTSRRPPSPPIRSQPSSPRPLSHPPRSRPSSPPLDFDQSDHGDERVQHPPLVAEYPIATQPHIRTSIEFSRLLGTSTLASQFGPEELAELLEPREHESTPPDDPKLKLSLLNYISLMGSSQDAYEATRQNLHQCYPDIELFSYYQVEQRARSLSGLLTWEHHMCVNSCVAFTGPYANLDRCPDPECGEPRYKEKDLRESGGLRKVPRQVFTTFPAGP
jgi:hypothetical protein